MVAIRSGLRALGVVVVAPVLAWLLASAAAAAALPQTGPVDADFANVDQAALAYLAGKGQPGVSVVVAYGDRIIYAQGYGWADKARAIPTSPWLEYRLASVSKTFTATAVLRLVEQGRLQLDAKAWDYVAAYMGAEPADARVKQITVRQLLTHSWGLNRATTADPNGVWTTNSSGQVLIASRELLRKYLLSKMLDFAPGTRYAYNGAGFSWLQLIAETVDGRPLDQQLSAALGPEALSTGRVRIGSTLPSAITAAEPTYYDYTGAPQVAPVPGLYPAPAPAQVARPYGAYTLASYGGGGGLIASPLTVARFVQRLQGIRLPALLKPETFMQMRSAQNTGDGTPNVGLGVVTVPAYGSDYWLTFNGAILGSRTGWLSTPRTAGGPRITIVALVNGSWAWAGETATGDDISAELLNPLLAAVDAMTAKKYAAKPEIGGERLIAFGSATEDYFADLLFDWGQRSFPALFPSVQASGRYVGYRYRYYPETQLYLGAKDGRIVLYQPSVSPAINDIAGMVDFLPQAVHDTDALK